MKKYLIYPLIEIFIYKGDNTMEQIDRVKQWRKENPEMRRKQKRREKLKKRLRDLSILPDSKSDLTEEQTKIIEDIKNDIFVMPEKWSWIRLEKNQKITREELLKFEEEYENKDKIEYILLKRARDNSKNRDLEFDLTIEDIVIPNRCPYFDIPFDDKRFVISIDRIDSSKGYVKGNIQIISRLANAMKNDSTKDELITFAKNILRIYNS
jgi:hypothetical protein